MRKLRTFGSCVALLTGLAVAGCSSWSFGPPVRGSGTSVRVDLAAAQAGVPQNPSNFLEYLAGEYVTLASNLQQQADLADSDYFARKALAAERGITVLPEDNAAWAIPLEIPNGFRTQLAQARTQLLSLLNGGARDRAPAVAARAQARYDCWTERMEDDWQHAQNGPCRTEFLAAIDQLTAKPASAPAAAIASSVIDIYFDFNRFGLTREGMEIIKQLATQLKDNRAATVTIIGKTDLAGSDGYNMALSKRRAEVVQTQLGKEGVATTRMTVQWTGKRQPPVPTADGVREPRNRVVEVTVH